MRGILATIRSSPFFSGAAGVLIVILAVADPAVARPDDAAAAAFKGRIAWSADGNHNEPDDWIASPMALAIFAEDGLERLKSAARDNEITMVLGVAHRETDGLRNSAFVLGPDGRLITRYDQLSAVKPFEAGANAAAMWFQVKGVPAVVTIGRDARWTELSELAAVAGARIHVHLESDPADDSASRLRRMQTWADLASFLTFTATVNTREAILWDDLRGRDESRAVVRNLPQPDTGLVEVYSPFSANIVARSEPGALVVATRFMPGPNPQHPDRTSRFNPQMKAWYEIGAQLIRPRRHA